MKTSNYNDFSNAAGNSFYNGDKGWYKVTAGHLQAYFLVGGNQFKNPIDIKNGQKFYNTGVELLGRYKVSYNNNTYYIPRTTGAEPTTPPDEKVSSTNQFHNVTGDSTTSTATPTPAAKKVITIGEGDGIASMVLGNLGLIGGLIFAYKKKCHPWGYIGYGALFGIIGGTIGTIADKTIFKK